MGQRFVLFALCVWLPAAAIGVPTPLGDSLRVVGIDSVTVGARAHRVLLRESGLHAQSVDMQSLLPTARYLQEALTHLSGLGMRQQGGVGSSMEISLNGLKGSAVRYFIDGVAAHASTASWFLMQIPLGLVERVEVYKGVVPPRFGGDALGGVVNVVTRKGDRSYLDISLSGGSFYTFEGDICGQYAWAKTGMVFKGWVAGNYSKNSYMMRGVEVWDESTFKYEKRNMRRFHDSYRQFTGGFEVGWHKRKWCDDATSTFTYSDSRSQVQTGMRQTLVVGDAQRKRASWEIAARYSKRNLFTEGLALSANVGYRSSSYCLVDTSYRVYGWDGTFIQGYRSEVLGRDRAIRHTNRPGVVGQASLTYAWRDRHEAAVSYALDYCRNKRYDSYDAAFEPTSDALGKHFVGLSYSFCLFQDRWLSTFFLKEYLMVLDVEQRDFSWLTGTNDVPRHSLRSFWGYGLSSRFAVFRALGVKCSYEHSVRLPSIRELLGNGATVYPNLKLRPERAHNVNLSLYGEWRITRNNAIEYEVTGFYRNVKDLVRLTFHGDRQMLYENVALARVAGVELDLRYHYGTRLRVVLNATVLDERNINRYLLTGQLDITYKNRLPNRPFYYGNLDATWRIASPFGCEGQDITLGAALHYVHWYFFTWEAFGRKSSKAIIPTQWVADAHVAWSFGHGRYSLSCESTNIFNQLVYDNYLLQRPGRGVYGKLRVTIN